MAKLKKKTPKPKKPELGADFDGMLVADGFSKAVLGFTAYQPDRLPLVVYDYELCVKVLMDRDDMDYREAVEYMEYNVTGSWYGEGTPVFLHKKNLK